MLERSLSGGSLSGILDSMVVMVEGELISSRIDEEWRVGVENGSGEWE
jgi:hypothetical protein